MSGPGDQRSSRPTALPAWRRRLIGGYLELRVIPVLLWSFSAISLGTALAWERGPAEPGWFVVALLIGLLLQGAVALFCVWTQDFKSLIGTVGAVLSLMAAITALGVFRLQVDKRFADARPAPAALAGACVYVVAAGWMLYQGATNQFLKTTPLPGGAVVASWLVWLAFVAVVTVGYVVWTGVMGKGDKPARAG
jgi:hypothetical protein